MQNNKMLQVRHRYLQARRDLEYAKIKTAENEAARLAAEAPKKAEKSSLSCDKCGKEFATNMGLGSHLRHRTCEKK